MLDAFHDGEHDPRGARPRGALRFIQDVNICEPLWAKCEVGTAQCFILASSLQQDSCGNGWLMCGACVSEYLGMVEDANK